jgi:hypothetical protein
MIGATIEGARIVAGLFGGSHAAKKAGRIFTLEEAAERALDVARRERLALVHIAEREGPPQFWFARNILRLVVVEGRRAGASQLEALNKSTLEGCTLDAGMTKLFAPSESEPRITDIQVPQGEFEKYLKWARTVQ